TETSAIQLLLVVQVVDCLLLPFILFSILRLINKPHLMGDMVNGRIYNVVAWATAIIVSILSVMLLVITVLGWFGVNV
ncbi:MAG: divalent metal cation transporter, partial [Chloroflexota bacterium]|nr:divalent metal cation transporter [Chloroflexota bacterium]